MAEVQGHLTPQTGFIVAVAPDFVRFDQETFIDFYQPLLSPTALGLFYALKSQLKANPQLNDRQAHSLMFDRLNVGVAKFAEARNDLEGVELLKTYFTQDEIGGVFVYVLQPTMAPEEFINDDLLSVRLLQQIGENRFNELVANSRRYQFNTSQLHNLTHDYFEVFHPDQVAWDVEKTTLAKARQTATPNPATIKPVPQNKFNFKLLMEQLDHNGVDLNNVNDQRRLILNESVLYGIDEFQMAPLVLDSIDFQTGKLQPEVLKRKINNRFVGLVRHKNDPVETPDVPENLAGLNEQERNLIITAKEFAPANFLNDIKPGYVTWSEQNILQRLIERSGMPKEVINILIYNLIVQQERGSLNANLADAIMNEWIKEGVKTAADALRQIKRHQKKRNEIGKPPRYQKRKNVKEELPDWAKNPEKLKNTPPSPEEIAEINRKIAEFDQRYQDPNKEI